MNAAKVREGFSLVELLISLGLIGLVISVSGLLYHSGVKGWMRSENQLEVQQNLRIALNTLTAEIRKADVIEIFREQKKIKLVYGNGKSRSYRFNPARNEIWLDESNNAVALHIKDCTFDYDGEGLLAISITTQALEGIESSGYIIRLNTRGKIIHEH